MWTSYNIMLRENVGFFDNQDKVVGKLLLPYSLKGLVS